MDTALFYLGYYTKPLFKYFEEHPLVFLTLITALTIKVTSTRFGKGKD
jgi:hypothetical protein